MSSNIETWLRHLGLAKYLGVFVEQEIDLDAMSDLDEADLRELGLPMGPRKKLMRAITGLSRDSTGLPDSVDDNGTVLEAAEPPAVQQFQSTDQHEAERRQLTVMFCDLVGSTELSGRLDPEDMRELLKRYQDAVAGVISRHGGYVANYLGDGVLSYFGWPVAHDEQAAQAVHAALAAVAAVPSIETPHGEPIAARVGIATGEVVVGDLEGDVSRQTGAVAGETPNLAARLEGLAGPNGIVVGDLTRRLIGEHFQIKDYGIHELKGIAGEVQTWRVIGANQAEVRFDTAMAHGSTFVGRQHELGLLASKWETANSGEGQVVLLSGEAGIGKSHLLHELQDGILDQDHYVLRYQCSSYHSQTAFYPITQHIERAAGFSQADMPEQKLDKLYELFDRSDDATRLVANILLLPYEQRLGTLDLPPDTRRRRTAATLIDQVLKLSADKPVLMLFEDVHWLDASSRELLAELMPRITNAPVLLVMTHRPDWLPEWGTHTNLTILPLSRLSRQDSRAIVESVAGSEINQGLIDQIVQRADGIPLFVEELSRSLVEHGADAAASDIPDTLQASLLARLDKLGAEIKGVIQVGAVLGREFQHRMIAQLVQTSEERLIATLDQLAQSGLLSRRGLPPDATYFFTHALVQDAAYASSLRSRRQSLHHAVALAMAGNIASAGKSAPQLIAYHFEEAGRREDALPFRIAAGDQATSQSAGDEAAAHYEAALQTLQTTDIQDRVRAELETTLKLANARLLIGGYAAQGSYDAWQRARSLATELNDAEGYLRAALGIVVAMLAKGQYASALSLFQNYGTEDAERLNSVNKVHYYTSTGIVRVCIGDFGAAKPLIDRALELNELEPCTPRHPWAGADPEVVLRSYDTMVHAWQLRPTMASDTAEKAIKATQAYDDPFSRVWALMLKLRALAMCGRYADALAYVPVVEEAAIEHGFEQRRGNAIYFRGLAKLAMNQASDGAKDIREGLSIWSQKGGLFHLGQWYAEAAAVALTVQELALASEFYERAIYFEDQMELPTAMAELTRIRGNLLHRDGNHESAEKCIKQAMAEARQKQAVQFELRAALDLFRTDLAGTDEAAVRQRVSGMVSGLETENDMPEVREARGLSV